MELENQINKAIKRYDNAISEAKDALNELMELNSRLKKHVTRHIKTELFLWAQNLNDGGEMSNRLFNIISYYVNQVDEDVYLEDIDKNDMRKWRQMGTKTLNEFLRLRRTYYKKINRK